MIILVWLLSCDVPVAQADTYERNYGIVRVEFSDAVCFCPDGSGAQCRFDGGVSCLPKPPETSK